jgi:serine protease Do
MVTLLMTASFLVGSWLVPRIRVVWEPGPLRNQAAAQTPTRAAITADEPVARAVSVASPSVVNIDTVRRVVREDWFLGPQTFRTAGSGSGVVIDPRGYVLTNDHVVAGADDITVTFGNGEKCRGKVLGTDRETDVGLIRLIDPPKNLAVAQVGDSRNLLPGQWAIAIGNPYGYQQTVTVGVVGHVGRAVRVDDRVYKSLIQTDAAINPGNSGGALVDIHGKVIGINTVVRSDAQGIGFAIPIQLAKGIVDELIKHGKVKRPWAGLNVQDVTPDIAAYLGLSRVEGAFLDQMDRRSPAWQAGVRPGDIVRELKGKKVRSRRDVEAITEAAKIGDRLPIVVEREGALFKGEIVVTEKP